MENSVVVFAFTFLGWNYPFWENFVQKIKSDGLSGYMEPGRIQICKIR